MKNQMVTAIYCMFACTALVACESGTTYGSGGVIHSTIYAPPSQFTNMDLTEGYAFRKTSIPAQTISNVATSEAMRHEARDLQLNRDDMLAHSDYADNASKGLLLTIDTNLAEGWVRNGADTVKHELSGLTCRLSFEVESRNARYLLLELKQYDGEGRDIACLYGKDDQSAIISVYASHKPDVTLEQMTSAVTASIRSSFTIGEVLSVPLADLSSDSSDPLLDGLEPQIAGGFDIGDIDDVRYKTAVWLAKTHGWHVKVRATYPKADITSEILSSLNFTFAHIAVRKKNMSEPVYGAAEV